MIVVKDLLSVEMLYYGWLKARKNRTTFGIDGENADFFEENLEENLEKIIIDIKTGNYKPLPAKLVIVPKPNGKSRPLTIIAVRDKIIQNAVTIYLEYIFKDEFSDISFGYRRNIGIHNAIAHLIKQISRDTEFFVKADIENFFGSIDRKILFSILNEHHVHEAAIELINMWFNSGICYKGKIYDMKIGIPQGAPISPVISNIYLIDFDRFAVSHNIKIARYADDMMFLSKSRTAAFEILNTLQKFLAATRKIKFNPSKIYIAPANSGIEFLGKKLRTSF